MTRAELYRVARRAVEANRQQAETQAAERRKQIYEAVPQLGLLDAQQAEAGAQAAGLAASGQADAAKKALAKLEDIRKRRQALLAQCGLAEREFEPGYACAICADTGAVGGEVCDCVHNEVKRLRREEINTAGSLRLCRFETFTMDVYPESMDGVAGSPRAQMAQILQDCREYADEFGLRSFSLLMSGDAGLGKTHLALAIAAQVLEQGWDVIYVSAQSAFATISGQRYDKGRELFDSMLGADLLVLDDLGTEHLDAYTSSKLYELINARLDRRPTIYTTNIVSQNMMNQRYTEKIASRLLGGCEPVRFVGQDVRMLRSGWG